MFGGRGRRNYDPMEFGAMWDPFSGPFSNINSGRHILSNGHAVSNTEVDWRETAEAHIFKANMPGIKKEEMRVQLLNGRTLEITGERTREEAQDNDTWHRVERSTDNFSRQFHLPENSNLDQVRAQVQDGVLTVEITKVQYPMPPVRIVEIV